MSIKDFSNAWDEATRHALETSQGDSIASEQLSKAAGLRVRTSVAAGHGLWGMTNGSGCTINDAC